MDGTAKGLDETDASVLHSLWMPMGDTPSPTVDVICQGPDLGCEIDGSQMYGEGAWCSALLRCKDHFQSQKIKHLVAAGAL